MFDLSPTMIMSLISATSKACEFTDEFLIGLHSKNRPIDAAQTKHILGNAAKTLAYLDEKYPGLVPVPQDGVQWKDRIE